MAAVAGTGHRPVGRLGFPEALAPERGHRTLKVLRQGGKGRDGCRWHRARPGPLTWPGVNVSPVPYS